MNIYKSYLLFSLELDRQDEMFEEIVNSITPLILKNANLIDQDLRDDFQQDFLMKLFEILNKHKFEVKVFKKIDFYDKKHLVFIKKDDESLLDKFLEESCKNKILYENAECSDKCFIDFIDGFTCFVGKIKFLKYIKSTCDNLLINYHTRKSKKPYVNLDEKISTDNEPIEKDEIFVPIDSITCLTTEEKEFLKRFYDFKHLLSQKMVAEIMHESPQNVSKRYNKIKRKIRKYYEIYENAKKKEKN